MKRQGKDLTRSTGSALLLVLLLAAGKASTAEPDGMIEGLLGERKLSVELDVDQSDWYGDGNSGGVSMVSRPVSAKDGFGRMSISYEGSDVRAGRFLDFEVSLGLVDSVREAYRATLDDGLEVTLLRIETHGEQLHIEGRAQGRLVRQEVRSGARDENDALDFDLHFSARLGNHY